MDSAPQIIVPGLQFAVHLDSLRQEIRFVRRRTSGDLRPDERFDFFR